MRGGAVVDHVNRGKRARSVDHSGIAEEPAGQRHDRAAAILRVAEYLLPSPFLATTTGCMSWSGSGSGWPQRQGGLREDILARSQANGPDFDEFLGEKPSELVWSATRRRPTPCRCRIVAKAHPG